VVKQEREMERGVAYIENNPVKAGLVAERLERRSRPRLRAEARSGTLKRAPRAGPEMYKPQTSPTRRGEGMRGREDNRLFAGGRKCFPVIQFDRHAGDHH